MKFYYIFKSILVQLTEWCSNGCPKCVYHCNIYKKAEVPLTDSLKFLLDNTQVLSLTGGEAFSASNFKEIVGYFLSHNNYYKEKKVSIISSGLNEEGINETIKDRYYKNLEYLLNEFKDDYSKLHIELSFSEGANVNDRIGNLLDHLFEKGYYLPDVKISVPANIWCDSDKEKRENFKKMRLKKFKEIYDEKAKKYGGPLFSEDKTKFYLFVTNEDINNCKNLNTLCYPILTIRTNGNVYPCCSIFAELGGFPPIANIKDPIPKVKKDIDYYQRLNREFERKNNIKRWHCRICTDKGGFIDFLKNKYGQQIYESGCQKIIHDTI